MTNSSNTPSPSRHPSKQSSKRQQRQTGAAESRPSPKELLSGARDQLAELTGMTAESVSSFQQAEDGWTLEIEVLEVPRVPDTMSLLATYVVNLDPQGELAGYRRVRRYERGRADAPRPGSR
jgi:hypothetical protein